MRLNGTLKKDGPGAIQIATSLDRQPHSLYLPRNSDFSSFPVDVCGNSCTKTKSSGSCHFAKVMAKKVRSSSQLKVTPLFSTTTANGLSCHMGCGTAITAASATAGCATRAFSTSTELIHSPPDLIRSLVRSVIFT